MRKDTGVSINFQLPNALVTLFVLGVILSPTKVLGGGYDFYDCEFGVIQQYKETATWISTYLETNDQVYWIGKDTQVVLLGILEEKDINIFPQQLNSFNSFRIGGNTDQIIRFGYWNDKSAQIWIDQSDVLIFEDQAFSTWFAQIDPQVNLNNF